MKIYYINVDIETFGAITSENIVFYHDKVGEVSTNSLAYRAIVSLVEISGEGPFSDSVVRAKLIYPNGDAVFIGRDGGIRQLSGDSKLNTRERNKLKGILRRATQNRTDFPRRR